MNREHHSSNAVADTGGAAEAHRREIAAGTRFGFGANWALFLNTLNDDRIAQAERSLKSMLEVESLTGLSFLDAGSGSGLFSLAARRLGATVTSFDYDPESVACTEEMKRRFFPSDTSWTIEHGSVLDQDFLRGLGRFDIVYSWGVLHHTGAMWQALANVAPLVAEDGRLFIALYNDQGGASARWLMVKKAYNRLPAPLRPLLAIGVTAFLEFRSLLIHLVRMKPQVYFAALRHYESGRGMSWWHDKVDWIGGLPFEVSRPEQVFDFYRAKGFQLSKLTTCAGGHGCNQFVFRRQA
jgi:2-polyprenyl-6-hydroxyphenyl methylase/3-demethylubiquinone-9 3-methyltransferase